MIQARCSAGLTVQPQHCLRPACGHLGESLLGLHTGSLGLEQAGFPKPALCCSLPCAFPYPRPLLTQSSPAHARWAPLPLLHAAGPARFLTHLLPLDHVLGRPRSCPTQTSTVHPEQAARSVKPATVSDLPFTAHPDFPGRHLLPHLIYQAL